MRTSALTTFLFVVGLAFSQTAFTQSPEMPEPLGMLVDADGKPMVQVMYISTSSIHVLFDFEGESAAFEMYDDYSDFENGGRAVFFSLDDCQGDVFISNSLRGPLERLNQRAILIAGPDADDGTYRVFRSTSLNAGPVFPESKLDFGGSSLARCSDEPGTQRNLFPAEELLPNPLEGFHGPTVASPERLITVKGGTRLP